MQSTIKARIVGFLLFRIIMTNGFKMSFWNVKLASSALSRYLMASCLKESIAYIAIFSSEWLPAETKCRERTAQILPQTWKRLKCMHPQCFHLTKSLPSTVSRTHKAVKLQWRQKIFAYDLRIEFKVEAILNLVCVSYSLYYLAPTWNITVQILQAKPHLHQVSWVLHENESGSSETNIECHLLQWSKTPMYGKK